MKSRATASSSTSGQSSSSKSHSTRFKTADSTRADSRFGSRVSGATGQTRPPRTPTPFTTYTGSRDVGPGVTRRSAGLTHLRHPTNPTHRIQIPEGDTIKHVQPAWHREEQVVDENPDLIVAREPKSRERASRGSGGEAPRVIKNVAMTRRRLLAASVLLMSALALAPRAASLTAAPGSSAAKPATRYGPPTGALVIAGGSTQGSMLPVFDKFIELGGGVDGTFVIVPTANGNFDAAGVPHVYLESQVTSFWRSRGLKHVKMLHTHDPKIADTVEFAKVLSDATAVWFTGGRHHHIVDSYAGTVTYREFHKVLERGGVIGGSSAGATIQGDYLVRGDSRTNTIMMTDEPNHQKGFGFLRRSAIDQHIDTRNRWDDLIPVIRRFPNLLGIGLSENTAIVVTGDQFDVIGESQVAIHDNTRAYRGREKPYYLLGAGDTYDMRTRRVVRHADVRQRRSASEPAGTATTTRGALLGDARGALSAVERAAVPADHTRSSAGSAPPSDSRRLAAPSGSTANPDTGSGAVPAPGSIKLALLERLLMIAGDDESWWQIEVIDVDSDGDFDLVRIHLVNGDTKVWEIGIVVS